MHLIPHFPPRSPLCAGIFIPRGQQPRGDCAFFSHVWALLPGFATASGVIPPSAWVMLNNGGDGRAPAGRVLHTAGQMGNQLYVFGGITQLGPVQDLWAFDLMGQAWAQCVSLGPQPPFNAGWGVGVVMGYHFYNYIQQYDRNGIVPNSGQLWRWTPIVAGGGGGGGFPDRGGSASPSAFDPISERARTRNLRAPQTRSPLAAHPRRRRR